MQSNEISANVLNGKMELEDANDGDDDVNASHRVLAGPTVPEPAQVITTEYPYNRRR